MSGQVLSGPVLALRVAERLDQEVVDEQLSADRDVDELGWVAYPLVWESTHRNRQGPMPSNLPISDLQGGVHCPGKIPEGFA